MAHADYARAKLVLLGYGTTQASGISVVDYVGDIRPDARRHRDEFFYCAQNTTQNQSIGSVD